MSVNRYEFEDYGTNEDDGRYVTYEDYAALEARCAALAGLFGDVKEIFGFKYRYFITSKGLIFSLSSGELRQLNPTMRARTEISIYSLGWSLKGN